MKKPVILLILFATAVFISGCIFDGGGDKKSAASELIPKTGLPEGFTYLGVHESSVDIDGSSINSTEGVYKNSGDDIYIQVIESDRPEALLAQYKLQIKNRYKDDYNPFEEVSFNGHTATKAAEVTTIKGQTMPRYSIIWTSGSYMILVGSSSDPQVVMALATATGR
ncbi:MAG: hypothetical protein OIN66_12930 [Candidatus Methanoperedens sp.]|nr:hypothetical protein [Candidatus Methanoperedens sp.]